MATPGQTVASVYNIVNRSLTSWLRGMLGIRLVPIPSSSSLLFAALSPFLFLPTSPTAGWRENLLSRQMQRMQQPRSFLFCSQIHRLLRDIYIYMYIYTRNTACNAIRLIPCSSEQDQTKGLPFSTMFSSNMWYSNYSYRIIEAY